MEAWSQFHRTLQRFWFFNFWPVLHFWLVFLFIQYQKKKEKKNFSSFLPSFLPRALILWNMICVLILNSHGQTCSHLFEHIVVRSSIVSYVLHLYWGSGISLKSHNHRSNLPALNRKRINLFLSIRILHRIRLFIGPAQL